MNKAHTTISNKVDLIIGLVFIAAAMFIVFKVYFPSQEILNKEISLKRYTYIDKNMGSFETLGIKTPEIEQFVDTALLDNIITNLEFEPIYYEIENLAEIAKRKRSEADELIRLQKIEDIKENLIKKQ